MKIPQTEMDMMCDYIQNFKWRAKDQRMLMLQNYLDNVYTDDELEMLELSHEHRGEHEAEYLKLYKEIFAEALMNFLAQACEQQREKCLENYYTNLHSESPIDLIRLAPMPELTINVA